MAWRRGTSFGEGDRLDRRRVGETREVVAQAAVACELDAVGDEDGVGGGAAGGGAASRENEGSGREVERPLEDEVAATGHGVLLSRADRAILKEEHRLHGSARGGVERSHGATADRNRLVWTAGARSVVEGDAGAVYRASGHVETASVEDVDTGRERHLGADASNTYAVAVHTGRENLRAAVDLAIVVIARCRADLCIGSTAERVRLGREM